MTLLMQLVSAKKQISQIFSMFTGISPAVTLSEGKFFSAFLTVASETHWKKNVLFNFLLDFDNTRMIGLCYRRYLTEEASQIVQENL